MNKTHKYKSLCLLRDYLKSETGSQPWDPAAVDAALAIVETTLKAQAAAAPKAAKAGKASDTPAPVPVPPLPIPVPTGDPSFSQILQIILEIIQLLGASGVIKV